MELLINHLLALDHPDWSIPWAGLGAILLGLGGFFSGIAALITARRKGRDEATHIVASRPDDDDGSGVSGGDSSESESSSSAD